MRIIDPLGFSHGQRFGDFFMVNSLGQPEEAIALSHFIMGGVLDRHPGLDVIIAHGGGFLPFSPAEWTRPGRCGRKSVA